ncbi:MAG: cobalamin-binding protein [Deltaproteobacteria bacterium]|nr:cobalamin-binding protein [Deltaproteobacteria bacterium]
MDVNYTRAACHRRRFFRFTAVIAAALFFKLFLFYSTPYAGIFTDEMGRRVEVKPNPSRIVSLAPHLTEILFDLGLGKQIVGVTLYSNYPEEAKTKARVGSYVKLNLEKIVSLSPDLVIATADGNPKVVVERLTSLGIPVFVINTKGISDIYGNIISIGEVTGRPKEGRIVSMKLRERIKGITDLLKGLRKRKVFFQLGANPLYTASAGTFTDDLITLAGGINIAGEEKVRYPVYSMEEVLKRNPEVIFSVLMGSEEGKSVKPLWEKWKTIEAVKKGQIYDIEPDITNRASSRIADGLDAIARKLHPEAFNDHKSKEYKR